MAPDNELPGAMLSLSPERKADLLEGCLAAAYVLLEVHDEAELERALAVEVDLVGVNQRDLVTFAVDSDRAVRVAAAIPDGVPSVAESGITGPDDVRRLVAAGYDAVLVGESVVTADDRAACLLYTSPSPRDQRGSRMPSSA